MPPNLDELMAQLDRMPQDGRAMIVRRADGQYEIELVDELRLPYIELKIVPSSRRYSIIHVPIDAKDFFPGYRVQFVLNTPLKPFVMHMTGADNGTARGDDVGGYICHPRTTDIDAGLLAEVPDANTNDGSFKRFYDANKILRTDDWVRVFRMDQHHYRLVLK
ncbi:MAG: hypothetical protein AABY13_03600 [Nanoarchaeota archaeon]